MRPEQYLAFGPFRLHRTHGCLWRGERSSALVPRNYRTAGLSVSQRRGSGCPHAPDDCLHRGAPTRIRSSGGVGPAGLARHPPTRLHRWGCGSWRDDGGRFVAGPPVPGVCAANRQRAMRRALWEKGSCTVSSNTSPTRTRKGGTSPSGEPSPRSTLSPAGLKRSVLGRWCASLAGRSGGDRPRPPPGLIYTVSLNDLPSATWAAARRAMGTL
jgi:hypothetical protein